MGPGISGKAPVDYWPGLTPDSDPVEKLSLQVRNQKPQSQGRELWGQEAMDAIRPPGLEHSLVSVRTLPFPAPSKIRVLLLLSHPHPNQFGGQVLFALIKILFQSKAVSSCDLPQTMKYHCHEHEGHEGRNKVHRSLPFFSGVSGKFSTEWQASP